MYFNRLLCTAFAHVVVLSRYLQPGVPQVPLLDDDTIAFGEEDNANKQFV